MNDKKISIVVPVHNAASYIEETINSVIKQTLENFELILVNDASTDDSRKIIERIIEESADSRIVLIDNPNPGSAARARNAGIDYATGNYLAFLDADDIWHREKLSKTLKHMIKTNSAFVFTSYEFADEDGKGLGKIVHVPSELNYSRALSRTVIFTSTVMFDLSKLAKKDIYMPEIKSEDTASWWKILKTGIVARGLDENLVKYRRTANTLSSNKFEAVKRIWNLYRKYEKLSLPKSLLCFTGWAFRAVARRL